MNRFLSAILKRRATLLSLWLMLLTGPAFAAVYFLPTDAGIGNFSNCTFSTPNLDCSGDLYIGNDQINLMQDLVINVSGNLFLDFSADINTNQNYDLTINVTGSVDTGSSVVIYADLNVQGTINLQYNTYLQGNITSQSDINIGNANTIIGNISSEASVTTQFNASVTGNIDAQDDIIMGNAATVNGNLNAGDEIFLGYASETNGNVTAARDITLGFFATVNGNATTDSDLVFYFNSSVNGTCTSSNTNDISMYCQNVAVNDLNYCETFDASGIPSGWTVDNFFSGQAGTNSMTYQSANYSLYTQGGYVAVTTSPINLAGQSNMAFSVWVRRGSDAFSEDPENANEFFSIQYLTNANNWVTLKDYAGNGTPGEIYSDTFALTGDQLHANFRLRFVQNDGDGNGYDYWHVDDVCLTTTEVTIPDPVIEYRFDESSWDGTSDEVSDSSGNGNHGTADSISGTTTSDDGAICRAASFNGTNQFINTPRLRALEGTASMSFWIKTTQTGENQAWSSPGIAGVEETGRANDVFWGWIARNGEIGVTRGNANNVHSNAAINDGVYHHVVLTLDGSNGAVRIYIDGVLDAALTTATQSVNYSFDVLGYFERTNDSSYNYLNALVDELLIFDSVLSSAVVEEIYDLQSNGYNLDGTLRDCASAEPDHFGFSHDGNAINCQAETVTLTAYDSNDNVMTGFEGIVNLSVSTNHGIWSYSGTNTFTETTADDGIASIEFTDSDNGVVTLALSNIHPESVSLNAHYNGITETSGIANAADDPDLTFARSGFEILRISGGVTSVLSLYNMVAGTDSETLSLRAISTDPETGVCTNLFTENTDVTVDVGTRCTNPATCAAGQNVTLRNNAVTTALPNLQNRDSGRITTPINLRFGANSTAEFTVNAPDIGTQPLSFTYDLTTTDPAIFETLNGSVNLQVRPASLRITDIDNVTITGTPSPVATKVASEPFKLTLEALDSNGNSVASFGRLNNLFDVNFSDSTLNSPVGGRFPGIVGNSAADQWQGNDNDGDTNNEQVEMTTAATGIHYAEAGKVNLVANINNFLGYTNDLGNGFNIASAAVVVRFTPAYLTATQPNNAIWANNSNSVYQGQSNSLTNIAYTVQAFDINNTLLSNYVGSEFTLSSSSNDIQKTASLNSTGGTLSGGAFSWTISDDADFDGSITFTAPDQTAFIWPRNITGPTSADTAQPVNAFQVPANAFRDTDGSCIKANATASTCLSVDLSLSTTQTLYYARLSLPEQVSADNTDTVFIPLELQYLTGFNGTTGEPQWAVQTNDSAMGSSVLTDIHFDASEQSCTLNSCPATGNLNAALINTNGGTTLNLGSAFWQYTLTPSDNGILQVQATIPNWLNWLWNDDDGDGILFIDADNDGVIDGYDLDDMTSDTSYLFFGQYAGRPPVLFTRPGFR